MSTEWEFDEHFHVDNPYQQYLDTRPDERDKFQRLRWEVAHFTTSNYMEMFLGFVVTMNSAFVWLELDSDSAKDDEVVEAIRVCFLVFFCVEISIKLVAFGPTYFHEGINRLDFVVVFLSIVSELLSLNGIHIFGGNDSALLIFRLIRVLRVFRLFTFFPELRIQMFAFTEAIKGVAWVIFLFLTYIYTTALVLRIWLGQGPLKDVTLSTDQKISDLYGSMYSSFMTSFQAVTEDGWVTSLARPIAEEGGPAYFIFFVFFMLIGSFGILNLLTAIFIEELYAAREIEEAAKTLQLKKKKIASLGKIKELFHLLDADGSGQLSQGEMHGTLATLRLPDWEDVFEELDMSPDTFHALMQYFASAASGLDVDGDGEISYDELLGGIAGMDEDTLRQEQWKLHSGISQVKDALRTIFDGLSTLSGVDTAPESLRNKKTGVEVQQDVFNSDVFLNVGNGRYQVEAGECTWDKHSLSVLRAMSAEDVASWLSSKAHLENFAQVFVQHHITGWVLPLLTRHDLIYELGMTCISTRKHFQIALEALRVSCMTVAAGESASDAPIIEEAGGDVIIGSRDGDSSPSTCIPEDELAETVDVRAEEEEAKAAEDKAKARAVATATAEACLEVIDDWA